MTSNRTFVSTITITSWPQSGSGFGFAEIVDGTRHGQQVSIKAPVVERLALERGWGATSLGRTCDARLGPNPGRRPDAPPWQLLDVVEQQFGQAAPALTPFGLAESRPSYGSPVSRSFTLEDRIAQLEEQVRELQDAVFDEGDDVDQP